MRFNILQKIRGSGSSPLRHRFAYIAWLNDIVRFPKADYRGVALMDDIEMKENTGMMQIYLTSPSQEYSYETTGDPDSKIFKVKFTGTHPGTEQEALEFAKNFLEEQFIVLIPSCESGVKVLGTPDAPLVFTSSHKSEKASEKFIFNFEQEIGSEAVYQLYTGVITLNKNIEVDMDDFLEQLKKYMKLDGSNLTDQQKQNLKTILGIENKNISNSDLSLNENRSFNLKNFILNFFSNTGIAKIGINQANPEEALDVIGNIKSDGLVITEGGDSDKIGAIIRNGDEIQFKTSNGWEIVMLKGDYVSDSQGIISPDTPVPVGGWEIGWYEPKISSVFPGTNYPNQNNYKSVENYFTKFYFNGTSWEIVSRKLPGVTVEKVYDPTNDEAPASMMAAAKRFDPSAIVLSGFTTGGSDFLEISTGYSNGYLKNDNTIAGDNKNLTRQNIDTTGYNKLYYKCYPSVITSSLAGQYVAVLGIKSDGTKIVIRESAIIPNTEPFPQTAVEETIDITGYAKISVSIGNLEVSSGQVPVIKLINTPYQDNAVMAYINQEVSKVSDKVDKPKGPLVLNSIVTFSAINTTTANATFNVGMLNLSGSGSYGLIKQNTLNEDSEMYIIYKENSLSNIVFGLNANNSFGSGAYAHHVTVRYNTSGANSGKLEIVAGPSMGYSQLSTTSNTNYSVGDLLKLGVVRKGLKYTFYVLNLTKGWGLKMEQECTPSGTPFVAHNTASPVIISYSGSTSIFEFKHTCFSQGIDKAINGDSITFGQSAATESQRWASQILGHNLVMGGGADTTASVLSRIQEIIKINPRRVLLMIGGNDILFGVDSTVWKDNLRSIRNNLVSAGIEVVHLFPTPRAGAGTLITFLKNEPLFTRDVKIDTNTALMNGNADTLAAVYNSGDNLHLNNAGHTKIAEIINNCV